MGVWRRGGGFWSAQPQAAVTPHQARSEGPVLGSCTAGTGQAGGGTTLCLWLQGLQSSGLRREDGSWAWTLTTSSNICI